MFPWQLLITGVVGVGGTALGAWLNGRMQTKTLRLSLDAETERVRLADKRRIYANFLAACDEAVVVHIRLDDARGEPEESWRPLATAYQDAAAAKLSAKNEVYLIASDQVRNLAKDFSRVAGEYIPGRSSDQAPSGYSQLYERLLETMRADLGETD